MQGVRRVMRTNITSKNGIPLIPSMDSAIELDPEEKNDHFEETCDLKSLKLTGSSKHGNKGDKKKSVESESFKLKLKKVFSLPERKLYVNDDGYEVHVVDVDKNGTFTCKFTDSMAKKIQKELDAEIEDIYEAKDACLAYSICLETLNVKEIVVAKIWSCPTAYKFIRGQIKSIDNELHTVHILDLDSNGKHSVMVHDLYRIIGRCLTLPKKLLKCKLADLEFFSGTNIASEVLKLCPTEKPMSYVMYFTGKRSESERRPLVYLSRCNAYKMVEQDLGKHILTNLLSVMSPLIALEENKGEGVCKLLRFDNKGIFWLKFSCDEGMWNQVYSALQSLRETLKEFITEDPLDITMIKDTTDNDRATVYCTEFQDLKTGKGEIRRLIVSKKLIEENEVKVSYIDYGTSQSISPSQIFPLEILHVELAFIPPLVLKVHLEGIKALKMSMEKLQSIIDVDNVVAKMVDEWPDNVRPPEVRILKVQDQDESEMALQDSDENDEEDYSKKRKIMFSSKTLSGMLLKKRLAIPVPDDEQKNIINEKLKISQEIEKQARDMYDEIEISSRRLMS